MSIYKTQGQFLHLGLRTFVTPYAKMTFFQYDVNDYVYYFSNEYNETIRFNGFEVSEYSSYIPFPSVYIRYDWGNNFYLQGDLFGMWFDNEAKYNNSVDFADYASVFNPKSELANLGYNSIKLKWAFMGNSVIGGYNFLKTKTIRPYLFAGISAYYLLNFEPGDYYEDTRSVRNAIIFQNLNTFRAVTFYYKLGAGFKYHGLTLDVYIEKNLGPIDRYSYDDYNQNIYYNERPNYESLGTINVSLGLNILSFNMVKKQSLN